MPSDNAPVGTPTTTELPPEGMRQPTNPAPGADAKVITMPTKVMARIKADERGRGAAQLAKELGFASVDAMRASVSRGRVAASAPAPARPGAPAPARPASGAALADSAPAPTARPVSDAALLRRCRDLEAKNVDLAKRLARAEKVMRETRKRYDASEAEHELTVSAMRAGVSDPELALELLRRELRGQSPEQLERFNHEAWFAAQKAKRPHMFNAGAAPVAEAVDETPVDTSEQAPSADTPAPKVPDARASGSGSDARKLDRDAYTKRLAELGIASPESGVQ
jgi:hypothetical protein